MFSPDSKGESGRYGSNTIFESIRFDKFDTHCLGPKTEGARRDLFVQIPQKIAETNNQRQINELTTRFVDSGKGLTCENDTSKLTEVRKGHNKTSKKASNPFPDQTPYQILTRNYKVADYTVTPSSIPFNLAFPQALLDKPAIAAAMKTFRYIRSGVKISVRVNGTPYHQGALMVSFEHDTTQLPRDIVQCSALQPIVMDYSVADTATMTVDYLHPALYHVVGTTEPTLGVLRIHPLVPVANTSPDGSTTIYVTIYAQFENPTVAGFVVPQSGQARSTQEVFDKTMDGLHSDHPGTVETLFTPVARTIDGVLDPLAKAFSLFDKPTQDAVPSKMLVDIGPDTILGVGLSSANKLSLYPGSQMSPFVDSLFTSEKSVSELAQVPMLHTYYTFSAATTKFDIGVHPAFLGTYNQPLANTIQPDFLQYVSAIHQYWRGSIKYFFQFFTNAFTTARIRISYIWDWTQNELGEGGDYPSTIVEVKGTTMKTLQVPYQWHTAYRRFLQNPGENLSPKIQLSLLTLPVVGTGTQPFITCVVWRAGGEDIQFSHPRSSQITLEQVTPQTSIHSRYKEKFDSIVCDCTYTIEHGYTTTETTGKISELCKRFCKNKFQQPTDTMQLNFPYTEMLMNPDPQDEHSLHPFWQLVTLFKYKRGGIRQLVFINSHSDRVMYYTPSVEDDATIDPSQGFTLHLNSEIPTYQYENIWSGTVPYIGRTADSVFYADFQWTKAPLQPTVDGKWLAFADDTTLSYLLYPLPFRNSTP